MLKLPLPTQFIKDVAWQQLTSNPKPSEFVTWLLSYWHLVPSADRKEIVSNINARLGEAKGAAADYITSRYSAWLPVVARQNKPEPLDDLDAPVKEGDIVRRARNLAVYAHDGAGQLYGDKPYSVHLSHAASVGLRYVHLLPEELRDIAIAVLWLHDVIEDGYFTRNEIAKLFGDAVAQYAQLMVSSTGGNRHERHDQAYHQRVRSTLVSLFCKLCDRLANVTAGENTPKAISMRKGYAKEQPGFIAELQVLYHYPFLAPLVAAIEEALAPYK